MLIKHTALLSKGLDLSQLIRMLIAAMARVLHGLNLLPCDGFGLHFHKRNSSMKVWYAQWIKGGTLCGRILCT